MKLIEVKGNISIAAPDWIGYVFALLAALVLLDVVLRIVIVWLNWRLRRARKKSEHLKLMNHLVDKCGPFRHN